ncbi:MAG TPA: two-component regulator propeller domain-containing protein [Opitutaceae bacterium]
MQVWQTDDGLPNNAITSVVQTRDGYMWVGTFDGLARFDGQRFQVFNPTNTPALDDLRAVSLFEDTGGTLWIGHETGAVTRYRDGHFESTASAATRLSDTVAIGSDEAGQIWALRGNGSADAIDADKRAGSLIEPGTPPTIMWTRNARGQIWVVENGKVARLIDGKWVPLRLNHAEISDYVGAAAASADGGVWLFRENHIRKYSDEHVVEDRGTMLPGMEYVCCSLELSDGTLAVGTVEAGLYLVFKDGSSVHLDRASGLPQNWVRCLYQDREGNVWFGSGSSGLVSIHPTAFSKLTPADQWGGRTVLAVAAGRDGGLWIGTEGAGLYHYRNGSWKQYTVNDGLVNPFIWAVAEDKAGQVWAGNWIGGPYRLKDEKFSRMEGMDTASGTVTSLYPDEGGALLIGSRDGVIEYKGSASEWILKGYNGRTANVVAVLRDEQGAVWIGLAHDGVVRIERGKITALTKAEGLPSNSIECLYSEKDALWIGTSDGGLACLKDHRFTTISAAHGLADNAVHHIADDGLGFLWVTTQRGIQRLAKAELNQYVEGKIPAVTGHLYSKDDGVPTGEYSAGLQAAGCKSRDGRLWFTSSKGLFAVDPTRIQTNTIIPPIVLDSLLVDGKIAPFHSATVAKDIPPDHERLEFRFTALSFTSPNKVRFKYRLEGIDKDWIETGAPRAAYYTHLPPGHYLFRVVGCNNDGVWNEAGASLAFIVAPFFWQTWWFEGFAGLLVLSAVFWIARFFVRRRVQRQMEELERQNAIALERGRIARDIHDDLGGTLTKIAMVSQADHDELRKTPEAAAILTGIYTTAREGIRALDQIVWAVNPEHDSLDSLVSYMQKYAEDYLGAASIRCRQEIPIDVPAWPLRAEVRHNLFLAFKEVLNNTVKHSGATEVSIQLLIESSAFILRIKDNGRGFDRGEDQSAGQDRAASGNGLLNLERRLASIGGRCEIKSVKGQGTEVTFIVLVSEPSIGPLPLSNQ